MTYSSLNERNAFRHVKKVCVNFCEFTKIIVRKILSISIIDYHYVIFILGIQIKGKVKNLPKIDLSLVDTKCLDINSNNIVASLTTFPERINKVEKTIITILKQSLQPSRLILWLAAEQFKNKEDDLPEGLLALKKHGLEIKWCEDIKSYKKIIPTLIECPNDIIITFDDDIYYNNNVIEHLYNLHTQNPNCVIANRAWRIKLLGEKIKTYPSSKMYWTRFKEPSFKNTVIGCGGTLYPPNSLHKDVLSIQKFNEIVPTQDDIWLWAMSVLNGYKTLTGLSYDMNIRNIEDTQQHGLCKINKKTKKEGLSGVQAMNKIAQYYPELISILKSEDETL